MDPSEPVLVPQSLPSQFRPPNELVNFPDPDTDDDWSENDHWGEREQDWLMGGPHDSCQYGSSVPTSSGYFGTRSNKIPRVRRNVKGKKRSLENGLDGINVGTITNLANRFFRDTNSSDDESLPPKVEMKYRRSKLDWIKLLFLPFLYILLMGVAFVFAFYTIQGLIQSYAYRVRSVQQIDVGGRYQPIGIAVFPKFSHYNQCEYRYYDNLSPLSESGTTPGSCGNFQVPTVCTIQNVTFNSTIAPIERFVMIFQGPTLVKCKQSLKLRFEIDTTQREFSAVEYILFDGWQKFDELKLSKKQDFLAYIEQNKTVYTFPAGFRTWVKLSYSIFEDYKSKTKSTEFYIIDSYASFNNYSETSMPMEVLFEWKNNHYDYVQEIVSTTAWSAFGSLCGLLLTLVKGGEFCKAWIRRLRRDREKKILHLKQMEEKQKELMESYEKRKMEKKEARLKRSCEATHTINIKDS